MKQARKMVNPNKRAWTLNRRLECVWLLLRAAQSAFPSYDDFTELLEEEDENNPE